MANLQAVSKERHADKRWQWYSSYSFAASDAVAALVVRELPKALMSLPIGFISIEDRCVPVAVQGLVGGQNLLVAPDGRWLGTMCPPAIAANVLFSDSSARGCVARCHAYRSRWDWRFHHAELTWPAANFSRVKPSYKTLV